MEGKNLDFPWSTIPGAYYILQVKFIYYEGIIRRYDIYIITLFIYDISYIMIMYVRICDIIRIFMTRK